MSRERIKSCLLAGLVMINFILGAKILNDKKLWPYGYNFFSFIENSDIYKAIKNKDKSITKTHITMPQEIFVNTGDQTYRMLLRPDSDKFKEVFSAASDTLVSSLKGSSVHLAKKDEWVSALNGKSLCFSYAVEYDTGLFGEFFAVDSSALAQIVPSFARIIVSADRNVFFEDFNTGNFYASESNASSTELTRMIDSLKADSNGGEIINYSVDLKFDESLGSQVATLSPAAPVYSAPLSFPIIKSENPIADPDGKLNEDTVSKIISVFRINSNTVRRYSEADGTLVCVENNCILKIRPSGVISYQSTNGSGLSLSADNSYIDSVIALANFTDKLTAAADASSDLYISKALSEKSTYVTFDYRSCGIPVNIDFGNHRHAVSAEIKNGSMTSYVQVFRKYTPLSGDGIELSPFISALDNAAEKYTHDLNSIEISEIYPVFDDNNEQIHIVADWFTKIKGIEIKEDEIE